LEPVFSQPRAEAGLLPGGLHYLNITVPKVSTDRVRVGVGSNL
tara:strand:+ start:824 stop:952 length:129 start_codon:yes stop_codon:yes gene_type:complete